MKRIALYQTIVAGKQKRGPHFFYPLFFNDYTKQEQSNYEIFYFVKTNDVQQIQNDFKSLGFTLDNVVFFESKHHRFKSKHEGWELTKALKKHRIDLFHLLTYANPQEELPLLKKVVKKNFKTAFTITYNGIPGAFQNNADERFLKDKAKYGELFENIPFNGLLSWYNDWPDFVKNNSMFSHGPEVYVIKSRYCDTRRFKPGEKQNYLTFASALTPYKHPLMFLEAVLLLSRWTPKIKSWKIIICGQGSEEDKIRKRITDENAQSWIELRPPTDDIAPLINESKVYVSCQEIDNFPSLAMNEAMAAGNAIIARPVGRTNLFVKNGMNGFIANEDNIEGIAKAIQSFIERDQNEQRSMMNESVRLTKEVHTSDAFIKQIDEFWTQIIP